MRLLSTRNIIRNLYGETLLENFLVSGVVAIIIIRGYLQLTGFPQIGGANFHVAHMLFGGLMMLGALFILFAFLNRTALYFASILGGVGFGFFIDEVGKFVTRDNNYFFQPTFAIIYIIFVLLYLATEALPKIKQVSPREYLVNALDLMKEVVIQDLDADEKNLVLSYLQQSDQKDPLVTELRSIVSRYKSKPVQENIYNRLTKVVLQYVRILANSPAFYRFVIAVILLSSVAYLTVSLLFLATMAKAIFLGIAVILLGALLFYAARTKSLPYFIGLILALFIFLGIDYFSDQQLTVNVTFIEAASFLSSLTSGIIALVGILQLRLSRERGLSYIRIALLIAIFLTSFFQFYSQQLFALFAFSLDILMLVTVETVLRSVRLENIAERSK